MNVMHNSEVCQRFATSVLLGFHVGRTFCRHVAPLGPGGAIWHIATDMLPLSELELLRRSKMSVPGSPHETLSLVK
jgi:hypothetical protein